jgi:Lar family restriction alleviation protein
VGKMATNELKPCPFCGGEAKVSGYYDRDIFWNRVKCKKCKAKIKYINHGGKTSPNLAVAAWNQRVTP